MKNLLGVKGETLAKDYLIKNKYKILEVNYTNKLGEIDIIVKQKDTIVFVEVKTRSSTKFGFPCESVTKHKQEKIKQVASVYLIKNKKTCANCRFDVIDILNQEITHITNAF